MNELDYENALASTTFEPLPENVRNTWVDGYTLRQRFFDDGQAEVTVVKDRHFVGPVVTSNRTKKGDSDKREVNDEVASRNAKKNVRLKCKTLGADRMVTLTYRENMQDREQALKDWKAFCRILGKHKQFDYVAVIEKQERGAFHFHVAVRGRQVYALLRSIWQKVVGVGPEGQKMAQVNVRDPHKFGFGNKGAHRIASYIAKYCGKDMQVRGLNEKRYFSSRGIPVPDVREMRLPCTTWMSAVQAAFVALAGYDLTGMQSWCNNGLGVLYVATGPGSAPAADWCPF